MSVAGLPDDSAYDEIHLGGETAVVIPLAEYRKLRAAALHGAALRRRAAESTIRQTAEEFLQSSGLTDEEQRVLRAKYGMSNSAD